MKKIATALCLPLATLVVVSLVGAAMGTAETRTHAPPPLPGPVEHRAEMREPTDVAAASVPTPSERIADRAECLIREKEEVESYAEILLRGLESCAASGLPVFPSREVEGIRDLLTRRPELADLFLANLENATPKVRTYILFAFYGLPDHVQRDELVAEANRLDPHHNQVREILSDRAFTLEVLLRAEDAELKRSILCRLGEPLLAEPDMRDAVWQVADCDRDEKSRCRAIVRLGKLDGPDVHERLLTILEDEGKPIADRQAAAKALRTNPGEEVIQAYLGLIEREAPAALLWRAANGLRTLAGRPEVADALLGLLNRTDADPIARNHAASSLVLSLPALKGAAHAKLERQIWEAIGGLLRSGGSDAVVGHALCQMADLGESYQKHVVTLCSQSHSSELRQQVQTHPAIRKYMESR